MRRSAGTFSFWCSLCAFYTQVDMLVFRWIIYGCIIMQKKTIFLSDFLFQLEKQKYMIYMYTNMHWLSLFTLIWFCQLTFEENKCFLRRHSISIAEDIPFKNGKEEKRIERKGRYMFLSVAQPWNFCLCCRLQWASRRCGRLLIRGVFIITHFLYRTIKKMLCV